MKRLLAATCLTCALVIMTGCQPAAEKTTSSTGSAGVATTNAKTSSTAAMPALTTVSLNVPNMT